MNQPKENIPCPPKHTKEQHISSHHPEQHTDHHLIHHMHHEIKPIVHTEPVHPYSTEIPKTFHEGHEKDIPDSKEFMEHEKFEQRKEMIDKHLTGENIENKNNKNTTVSSENDNKGFWEGAKDALSGGVETIKNIITGKNNKK